MSFGFSHLIIAWAVGKGYEYFSKKEISHYAWFFLLLGGILPDADFLIDWTFGTELHRTFTHSLFFVVIAPLLVYILFGLLKNKENTNFMFALAVGIITHLLLDMFLSKGVPLFWPNLVHFSYTSVGYFDPTKPSFLNSSSAAFLKKFLKSAILDMAFGTTWIFYLWFRKRIKF